jgi:hypothetical protein
MKNSEGISAQPQLETLETELKRERAAAIKLGTVDRECLQKTVRWVIEWVPEKELTLLAALGQIARSAPPALS